jgi:NAD(P)-dependent dehydrogenase (short-subunit alcohol dehydrogenase family)
MSSSLHGKVAIVTGATSGIGNAAALLFAAEGAKLVVTGRRAPVLDQLVETITASGGTAIALAGDVTREDHASALVALATGRFGGLDIAFNNAGILGDGAPGTQTSLEAWNAMLASNLTSAFLGAKHQIPAMIKRGGGSVIFTSSFVGNTVGFPGMTAYAASKSGLTGLTQVLAAENGPQNVRVNALLPGATETPMGASVMADADTRQFIAGLNTLKRIANPSEIANVALFLASDAASFVNGANWLADAGVSITRT